MIFEDERRAAYIAILTAVFTTLAACSPPQRAVWSKEGVTKDELKRDQKSCYAEANSYDFLVFNQSAAGAGNVAARQQGDIYRACMAKKGYTEGRGDAASGQGQTTP